MRKSEGTSLKHRGQSKDKQGKDDGIKTRDQGKRKSRISSSPGTNSKALIYVVSNISTCLFLRNIDNCSFVHEEIDCCRVAQILRPAVGSPNPTRLNPANPMG